MLFEMHDKSGHQGKGRTYELTRERFAWPGLSRDVGRCVESCPVCNARKPKPGRPEGLLCHPEIISEPFFAICIDVMELPRVEVGVECQRLLWLQTGPHKNGSGKSSEG